MNQADELFHLAQQLASDTPDFFKTKGPGAGDRATNAFVNELRSRAIKVFGADHAEKEISGDNGYRVDYYFPDEATIVEIALGLPKPKTEFELDILKAILAKEAANPVSRLVFISKPGASKKCSQPGRSSIIDWLARNYGIKVDVVELVE